MQTYYTVGQPMRTVAAVSTIVAFFSQGATAVSLGARQPRELTEALFKREAFAGNKISIVFTSYAEAEKYVKARSAEIEDMEHAAPFQSGAPILEFETDKLTNMQEQEEPASSLVPPGIEFNRNGATYIAWSLPERDISEKVVPPLSTFSVIKCNLSLADVTLKKATFPTISNTAPVNFQEGSRRNANIGGCAPM